MSKGVISSMITCKSCDLVNKYSVDEDKGEG
jgi:hypothetical protein